MTHHVVDCSLITNLLLLMADPLLRLRVKSWASQNSSVQL